MERRRWIKGREHAIKRRIMQEFMGRDGTDRMAGGSCS